MKTLTARAPLRIAALFGLFLCVLGAPALAQSISGQGAPETGPSGLFQSPMPEQAQPEALPPGYREPYCGCGRIVTPIDCEVSLKPIRARVGDFAGKVRSDCRERWKQACEAQYGWMECAKADPAMIASQCDEVVDQWRTNVARPQVAQAEAQCAAQNEAYRQECVTEIQPAICGQCDAAEAEVAKAEQELAEKLAQAGADDGVPPLVMLSSDRLDPVADAREQVPVLQRRVAEKRADLELLRTDGYCP